MEKGGNDSYSLFLLLLDMEKPWIVLKRGEKPLLEPREDYETEGFFPNVVFTNGSLFFEDELLIYYGSCDESCCLFRTSVPELLDQLL